MSIKFRVRVKSGDGSTELGEGEYVGDVSLYYFVNGETIGSTIRSISNPEQKPDDATINAMAEDGFRLLEDLKNPKIVLDNGKVVYGCQVWWEEIDQ